MAPIELPKEEGGGARPLSNSSRGGGGGGGRDYSLQLLLLVGSIHCESKPLRNWANSELLVMIVS